MSVHNSRTVAGESIIFHVFPSSPRSSRLCIVLQHECEIRILVLEGGFYLENKRCREWCYMSMKINILLLSYPVQVLLKSKQETSLITAKEKIKLASPTY